MPNNMFTTDRIIMKILLEFDPETKKPPLNFRSYPESS